MSATAAMDARTLLGMLGRERRRLRSAREAAPRHAGSLVGFGPAGRAAPSSPITERRSVEGEEAIDVGTTSEGKSAP
jgi:hypothetical protein